MLGMTLDGDRVEQELSTSGQPHERRWLWTPWRMQYVGGAKMEPGCVFCRNLQAKDDRESLILHRDQHAFVIMNLYPYNTGHTMIVPRDHCPSPEIASADSLLAMAALRAPLIRATRRAIRCEGFNLGMNIGAMAGAGITDHLHEHVVPRWIGDANFMPVLSNTKVLPEMLPVSYAKLRAELTRELHGTTNVACLVLNGDDKVLVNTNGELPTPSIEEDESAWMAAARTAMDLCGTAVNLTGWAGPGQAGGPSIQLEFRIDPAAAASVRLKAGWRWQTLAELGAV